MAQKFETRESVVLENEGQTLFGIFHRPCGQAPFPAVLICHGFGGNKTGKYRIYVHLAEYLSRRGIASLRVDFRGSGDSEGHFSDATLSSEASDAVVALDYLRKRPDVDPERVGIFGRSVGGTVALMTAQQAGPVKSLAVWAPLFDGEQWTKQWELLHAPDVSEEDRKEGMKVNGQVPGVPFFKELFAMRMEHYLNKLVKTPLLHMHGEQDVIVTPRHADRFERERKHLGKHLSKFIRLPFSDHDFSHTKEQLFALEETAGWFASTL